MSEHRQADLPENPYQSPGVMSARKPRGGFFVVCWMIVSVIATCGVFTVTWLIIGLLIYGFFGGDDLRYPGLYAMPLAAIPTFFAGWFLVRDALRRRYIWILVTLVVTMPMLMWFGGNLIRYGF